ATDRIRAVRRREPTGARGRQAGDLRLPGLHPHLWAEALERGFHREAGDGDQAAAGQAERGEARTDAPAPRADPDARPVAARRGARVLQLPRNPGQHGGPGGVPHRDRARLATRTAKTWSASAADVGALQVARRSLATPSQGPAPVPERAFLRQTPEVRAVCGSSARTDLRGGTPARAFPTATDHPEDLMAEVRLQLKRSATAFRMSATVAAGSVQKDARHPVGSSTSTTRF